MVCQSLRTLGRTALEICDHGIGREGGGRGEAWSGSSRLYYSPPWDAEVVKCTLCVRLVLEDQVKLY